MVPVAGVSVCVGVDGCKGGWIAVWRGQGLPIAIQVYSHFSELAAAFICDAIIAVDIPIGLPDKILGSGRVAEQSARKKLPGRASSVFSVPSRKAIEMGFLHWESYKSRKITYEEAYNRTKKVARETSEPPKSLSRQAFGILPKIAEVDRWLQTHGKSSDRVCESHPEVAFAVLNNGKPMAFSKRRADGVDERRELLASMGFDPAFLRKAAPSGASVDDFLDACAMLLVAERVSAKSAERHPEPPDRDRLGFLIAIHA